MSDGFQHVSRGQPPYFDSLSILSARSFPSTDALIAAVLLLIAEQSGLRTSFLTHITPGENRNHVVAVHHQPDGVELEAGSDLPLHDTF